MTRAVLVDNTLSIENMVGILRRYAECGADLQLDSRAIIPGDIFVANPGIAGDGRSYIQQAIERGAAAVLMHAEDAESWVSPELRVPGLAVVGLNEKIGLIADVWYGSPSADLQVIAITGTNGKTSCTQWLADALNSRGQLAGVIGTLGMRLPDGTVDAGLLTTPDVVSVHRMLAKLRDVGAQYVAIEASSIGIVQGRLTGVRLTAAAFTNLSRDHLDYHQTMTQYELAKSRLFMWPGLRSRHINIDDEAGQRIAQAHVEQVSTFGMAAQSAAAEMFAGDIGFGEAGMRFMLQHASGRIPVNTHLLGRHNVSNLLCIASILSSLGWTLEQLQVAFEQLRPVDGRLQYVDPVVSIAPMPVVIVDYAHTPDALCHALESLGELATKRHGKLWCVFGCGGNRDAGKRPQMGRVAMQFAHQIVLTNDNPRDELPEVIIEQIVAGLPHPELNIRIETDRAQAILGAVLAAEPNDIVLVAGKGHETYQEFNGVRTPFDDREWSRAALLLRSGMNLQSDSRRLETGQVFLALRGESFDGHDYLSQVERAGACAAIVDQKNPDIALSQIALGDTRAALLQFGRAWRRQFDIPVIGVAGSNGKTTSKEMVASILSAWLGEDHRLATAGNLNNELGVPFTLLRLTHAHRAAVIELGMNHPGEIAVLSATALPTIALVNNAQREHQEFMVSVEAVARENGQVFKALPQSGVCVFPAEDEYAALWAEMSGERTTLRFGLTAQAEIWSDNIVADALGTSFVLHTPIGDRQIDLPVPGEHNLKNALAATACALAAGATLDAIATGLSSFKAVSGRMQPHRLPEGVIVIDDTYNANPDSVRAAIDVLSNLTAPRVLVLGDMGEVGDNGPAMHAEVGAYARQCGIDHLITLGDATRESARAFGEAAVACETTEQVSDALARLEVKSVLIKGSRFMRMERIVRQYLDKFVAVPGELLNHAV